MKPEVEQLIESLVEEGHELLFMEPRTQYDDCVIGVTERFNDTFVLYSRKCVLDKLKGVIAGITDPPPEEAMSEEDAEEYFAFNVIGAWMGPGTPAFILDDEQEPSE